ncbi:MAG: alpha/beta hydrolase-fold protein [Bacteroidota bacterium]
MRYMYWLFLFLALPAWAQKSPSTSPLSIGEVLTFDSKALDEARILNVYLPQGYQDSVAKSYPVIYILDGSMDEDFLHLAGLVQFGSFPWINMIPQSIVVGIANVDRKRDFTYPSKDPRDSKDFPTSGGSQAFIQFLTKEVPALLKKTYRMEGTQTLIGQSLGGLLASEILLTSPASFDHYIIISPSLWWDEERLLKEEPASLKEVQSVYIGVGAEGPIMERVAKELYQKMQPLLIDDCHFQYFPEQNHGDALHLAVYAAFEYMYERKEKK